jgi:hypothetical protein
MVLAIVLQYPGWTTWKSYSTIFKTQSKVLRPNHFVYKFIYIYSYIYIYISEALEQNPGICTFSNFLTATTRKVSGR